MGRFGRAKQSWTPENGHGPVGTYTSSKTTGYEKFKLLLWKNYKIQTRHLVQTFVELLLPLLFSLVLVIVRVVIKSKYVTEPTTFEPFELKGNVPNVVASQCDRIFYTPKNEFLDQLMQKMNEDYFKAEGLEYKFISFETEKDLVQAFIKLTPEINRTVNVEDFEATPPPPLLGGFVFKNFKNNKEFPKHIEYTIRLPASQRSNFDLLSERFGIKAAWFTELTYPLFQLLGPRAKEQVTGGLPGYFEEGFLYMQYAMDSSITKLLLKSNETLLQEYEDLDIKLQRFPYPPYIDDKYLFALQAFLPILMMLSFIYPAINITKNVCHEKEKRLKESMKIMGLPNWLHWMAWFIKSYVFLFISVVMMTVLLKIKWTGEDGLAVIPETDSTVFCLILFTFCFQLISFSFCVSSFFSKANAGATAAGVFWFLWYVPYVFLQPRYNLLSHRYKIFTSFLFNTPISYACQIICMFEGSGAGLQWNSMTLGASPDDDFSIADCLFMMIFNGVFYLVVAWYIEAVWPGEYGIPLPWYFPLTKWYWTGDIRIITDGPTGIEQSKIKLDGTTMFEQEPNARAGIQILGLTKHWGPKTAVNNLHLTMYEGQITALLGHNGAGKTTTMSMLTGIFPPSNGTAMINGFDICKDIKGVRSSLGLCPQHDILFDELTVEEHLYFFCRMKGMAKNKVPLEVNRMVTSLGLEPKRHCQSHTLSGGMKRKLSVGVALCAGSKVVLLDEPTSGMDPGARRSTWDLIQTEKKGRTIVLSTHFMDEADLLGDRIAIMAEGEIQCCGSSLFLKKKYGGGYHLTIVKHPGCIVENITNVLKQTISDVEVEADVGAELSYSLPDELSHLFPPMFSELERRKDELGIASYGASITTMEEVFIKAGKLAEEEHLAKSKLKEELKLTGSVSIDTLGSNGTQTNGNGSSLSTSKVQLYQDEYKRNTGFMRRIQQFHAMLVKKLIYAIRNRVLLIVQMGIPCFYLTIVLLIMWTLPGLSDPGSHELTLDRYENLGNTITTIACNNDSTICSNYEDFVTSKYVIEKVTDGANFTDYILQKELEDLPLVSFKHIIGFETRPNDETGKDELVGFFNNQPFHTPPLTLNFITNAILRTYTQNYTVTVTNYPLPYSGFDTLKETGQLYSVSFQVGYNIAFGMSFLAASFVVFLIQERESKSKHLQFVSGVEFPVFWFAGFLVDAVNYAIPCFSIMACLCLFQTEDFYSWEMQIRLLIIMLMYGWAAIPFMYLWSFCFTVPSSGFVRMTMFNIFTGIASMLTVVIIQIPDLGLGAVVDSLNDIFLIFPNYALGMGIVQLATNYQYTKQCSTFQLEFICEAFPENPCCAHLQEDYFSWKRVGIGKNVMYLYCIGMISFVILFISESKVIQSVYGFVRTWLYEAGICGCFYPNYEENDELIALEDSDVLQENDRIRKTNLTTLFQGNNLVLRDLTKYYGNFLAVDNLNLAVKRGETFGLLGVNGAGKTTTFKMLTGDIPITDGDAYLYSASVRKNIKKVHENLGYCPQFDAIIEEMTGRETIRLFSRLRGIQEKEIDNLADKLAEELLFTKHIDKIVKGYSGGNKRKLSTALALVGNPPIVFLDEPTTGMDPVARRHLWNAITRVRESGTSIVLTSHSMEECEALCSSLAIMVNGKFRCLGSPQHLKSKFGEGYTLIAQITPKTYEEEPFTRAKQELGRRRSSSMKIRRASGNSMGAQRWETDLDDLRTFIEDAFPGCVLKDIHPGFVHYHVVNEDVTWGAMFETMEIAKTKFKLEAYSVGQTSLEQVFLNFTKTQINIDD